MQLDALDQVPDLVDHRFLLFVSTHAFWWIQDG